MVRRQVGVVLALIGALVTPAAAQPAAQPAAPAPAPAAPALGSYESAALQRALSARQLTLEPDPAGKTIARVHVVNLEVFGPDEAWLRWANVFHITTKEPVIERVLLLGPGQAWDADKVEESRRLISDSLFTTLVVIVPVVSATPGRVDLLVVTRDIWSLRLNSRFEYQDGKLSELSLSLSENNLLGLRKQVAFVFDMDLGAFSLGPQYVDKDLGGTRLALVGKWGAIFSRETGDFEGTRSYTAFSYPLYSLDSKWAAGIEESHFDGVSRLYCGAELFDYGNLGRDDPDTGDAVPCDAPPPAGQAPIPAQYGLRTFGLTTSVVRQLGTTLKHRVYGGHELGFVRPRLLDDFAGDAATAAAFAEDLFPRSERTSALFLKYAMFTPRYVVYRDLDSFDLAEDVRLGPEAEAKVAAGREELGSEVNFVTGSAEGAWTWQFLGDGYLRFWTGGSVRRAGGELTDRLVASTTTAASPVVLGMRLVARFNVGGRFHDTNNQFYEVGGTSGLRGYPILFFRGDRKVVGNLELRTQPRRLLFTRVGAVAFWDVGHAAQTVDALSPHHDVGVGLRGLVPQLQPYVFRFDWALPLTGATAGFPGRFTAGVQQAF